MSAARAKAKASALLAAAGILHGIAELLVRCAHDEQLVAMDLAQSEWRAFKATAPKRRVRKAKGAR